MCPNPKKPAPAAATLPTTQSLDELDLASGNMLDAGAPVGRMALNTRGKSNSARPATTSAASALVDALGFGGSQPAAASGTPSTQQPASGDPLGFQGEGRKLGSKQDFYVAEA